MFLKKIDELLIDISYVFGIVDDILITGFDADGREHGAKFEHCKDADRLT